MKKVVFFFGAGADAPYGIPCGGEFALEIFRFLGKEDKDNLKKELNAVDQTSKEVEWFPIGYQNNNISIFSKTNFESIISSTLESKREDIISTLFSFDLIANAVKKQFLYINIDIDKAFMSLGITPGDITYSRIISLNKRLTTYDVEPFFGSNYFSLLIELIKRNIFHDKDYEDASIIAKSLIEILIGALGKNLTHSLNNGIFEKIPDDIPFFDDIGGMFNIDYKKAGVDALTYIMKMDQFNERCKTITDETQAETLVLNFFLRISEIIYSKFTDYQSLIDSHYRFLYQPKKEWAKFTKISTFLFSVHRYMSSQCAAAEQHRAKSYYEDIQNYQENIDILAVGTSNYTNLVETINSCKKFYLNGSLNEYYDPYRNDIVDINSKCFKVPFIFTQSGIKPMTCISMSRRYIDFFDKCRDADSIVVLGYGFNSDDGHINTLIRSLIDDYNKNIEVILYNESNTSKKEDDISIKIRCKKNNLINVHSINDLRQIGGKNWLEYLFGDCQIRTK